VLKKQLRKEMLQLRSALTASEVATKSKAILNRLLAMEAYRSSGFIMTYLHFRNEVETTMLVQKAMADGKKIVVPVTDTVNRRLIPSLVEHFPEDLEVGTMNILEPKGDALRLCNPLLIDLVIVPGLVFDLQGYRIGYGGGFYDRFLPLTKPGVVTVGLAFELQIVERFEHSPYDIPVNYVLTEDRVINVNPVVDN
jgi:5-formyltetrahydrofolate cyclo-ligase